MALTTRNSLTSALVGATALICGCTGSVGSDPTGVVGPQGETPITQGPPLTDCALPSVQSSPMRRLTRQEYNNTVRDLLGDATRPGDRFVAEAAQNGFSNGAESTLLSAVVVEDFETAAGELAETAVANLPALLGCDPAVSGEDACALEFINRFGARAFRRPLESDQTADYQALYTTSKAEFGFDKAIELVVRAMLQSPFFLYRLEFGVPDPVEPPSLRLSAHETAARLSYLFWGSLPDAPLISAAEQGLLDTREGLRAQAERMLADERGAYALTDFHLQWGDLERVPDLNKNDSIYTPDLGRLLLEETEQFVDKTLRAGDGLLSTLLTSPVSYLNQELANYYGVTGPSGTELEAFEFPAGQRTGLLTQASFMASYAHEAQPSPVLRGKFVLEQMLCTPPPPPPNDVNAVLPVPDPSKTAREQLIELTSEGVCAACHGLINPPGFAFEHFDALGRYREMDSNQAIDASGDLVGTGDATGHFENHVDFLNILANSESVRSCMVDKWFVYTHGRTQGAEDACSLSHMAETFQSSGGNVRELLLSLVETPAFLYRANPRGVGP